MFPGVWQPAAWTTSAIPDSPPKSPKGTVRVWSEQKMPSVPFAPGQEIAVEEGDMPGLCSERGSDVPVAGI